MAGVDNDSPEGRALLAERDALIGKVLDEPDEKVRQEMRDRVDAVQKKLGQEAHFGTGKK